MSPLIQSPDFDPGTPDIAKVAFEEAIKSGRLSEDEKAPNYAGNFMYMGSKAGKALFKDSMTRDYLP